MRQKTALAGLIGLMARTSLADGHRVQGHATIISADTLIVQDQLTYHYQINSRDTGQTCRWLNKVSDCGKVSWTALLALIASQTPWQWKAVR
ncbi:MAG: hypothetical protein QF510_03955 [Rhodospirillales bacterium]|nr:hypothetical protein [Rhodospirillales bacterium]